jgi:hypothetical protein
MCLPEKCGIRPVTSRQIGPRSQHFLAELSSATVPINQFIATRVVRVSFCFSCPSLAKPVHKALRRWITQNIATPPMA